MNIFESGIMSKYKYTSGEKIWAKNKKAEASEPDETQGKEHEKLLRFLKSARVEEFFRVFRDNEIGFDDLKLLKESDVQELGLPIGARNRLMNALENVESTIVVETEESQGDEVNRKMKEILQYAGSIAQKQGEMMDMIKRTQNEIVELQEEMNNSEYQDASAVIKDTRQYLSSTSPKIDRIFKPTLSSIAKQKVLPNKYMQVSPLRASYYSKLMN